MSNASFVHLLAPGEIGPMRLENRIVLPAMDMNVSEHGEIEQPEIDHYVARAKGGAGLIITGACAITFPYGAASMKEPGLSEDRFIPGLKALADAGVNIEMISTSEIRISVVTAESKLDDAVRAVHAAFGLDADLEATVYGGTGR